MIQGTIGIDPSGGDVDVEISSGYALAGSYQMMVLPDGLKNPMEGDFLFAGDDRFELGPAADLVGQTVRAQGLIANPDGTGRFAITVRIYQGGEEVGSLISEGSMNRHALAFLIYVDLGEEAA